MAKLRENGWNISRTAEVIQTPRSNLYKKIEHHKISREGDCLTAECSSSRRLRGNGRPPDRPLPALFGSALRALPSVRAPAPVARARPGGRPGARLSLSRFAPAAVVSPALGGFSSGTRPRAPSASGPLRRAARRGLCLPPGFAFDLGERAVVVEDVFTTGKSTREAIGAAEGAGARIVAAGSIVDRGLPPGALPVPSRSLLSVPLASWPEAELPLCAEGIPIDTPGSRHAAGRGMERGAGK